MTTRIHHYRGFTIIEVSLALIFLSILLVTIAMLTIHISTTYQKGITIQAISSTGRELIDDFTRSFSASSSFNPEELCTGKYSPENRPSAYNACKNDGAKKLIANQRSISGRISLENGQSITEPPVSGAFCTGQYSYIYNTGYAQGNNRANYKNNSNSSYNGRNFRLLKVDDPSRSVCAQGLSPENYTVNSSTPNYETNGSVEEMLGSTENDLAIYDFKIFTPSYNNATNQSFYSGTFILATVKGGVNIKSTGNYCTSPPDNLATDFAYCAINKFNFATRATGGTH